MADADDDEACRGRRRGPHWVRVSHGLHRAARPGSGVRDDLLAWRLVLPPSGAFTSLTAAQQLGWWLPPLPSDVPVFAGMTEGESRPQRSGLRVTRLRQPPTRVWHQGVPVTPPAETLLGCARDLGLLDLVVLCDAALQRGHCTLAELHAVASVPRRGAPLLRRAIRLADGRSESPWETLLRVLHVVCRVPVEPQHVVHDDLGGFVARGDLWIPGTTTLHEYDGADHLERSRQRRDLARQRRLADAGWTRRGYTSVEVLHQAVGIVRDSDRSLGRVHRPERVRAWHALLAQSLFTARGTAMARRRWGLPPAAGTGGIRQLRGA